MIGTESRAQSTVRTPAQELLAKRDAESLATLALWLTDDTPAGSRRSAAAAIAESPPVPPELVVPLATAIARAPDSELPDLMSAARWYGDRTLVGAVIDLVRRDSVTIRSMAMATLRTQTGDAVDTENPVDWIEWWNRSRSGTDGAWWRMIAMNRAMATRTTQMRQTSMESRLRRLFLDIQPRLTDEERSGFIADLMNAPDRADQSMGLELAERALLNARSLGPAEVKGAAHLLRNPNLDIRARAAALLDRSDPSTFRDEVRGALRTEADPEIAASLLRLVGRSGACEAELDVLRWLREGSGPAYAAALDSAAALLAAGCFTQPDDRDEIARHAVAIMLRPGLAQAGPSVARICALLNLTWALRQLLASPIEEVARIAAEALANDPSSTDMIVDAARSRPSLFSFAANALARSRANTEGMSILVSLPGDEAARIAGVATMARAMPTGELARSIELMKNPEMRVAAAEQGLLAYGPGGPEGASGIALRLALADALIELGRAPGALAVLESPALPPGEADARRCTVLVWLGRLDDAQKITDAGLSAWMAGLEKSAGLPHARDAARIIETLFAAELTDAQRARIQEIADPVISDSP